MVTNRGSGDAVSKMEVSPRVVCLPKLLLGSGRPTHASVETRTLNRCMMMMMMK